MAHGAEARLGAVWVAESGGRLVGYELLDKPLPAHG